jgi:hypothetical protein
MLNNDINIKLEKILQQIQEIKIEQESQQKKIQKINEVLTNHINFIDNTYTWLSPSLHFIQNKVNSFNTPSTPLSLTNSTKIISPNFIYIILLLFLYSIWKLH